LLGDRGGGENERRGGEGEGLAHHISFTIYRMKSDGGRKGWQVHLWGLAGASAAVAAFASFADWRRQRRRDPDRVGFMPWTLITVLAVLAALMLTAFALRGG